MQLKIIREVMHVDESRQIHIDVPVEMGDTFEVILMPVHSRGESVNLGDEDRFNLSAYAAVVEEDAEEDKLWERYTRA